MGTIKISDFDVGDVNIEVAKQFLMKARCVKGCERKVKSLVFAKQAIENAMESFGMEIKDIQLEKTSSLKDVNLQANLNNKQ